ncbi:MAG: RNA methyltransferase [Lachnospiraceae bacterium]|nr:RNA methyltransferase [Lachnospiraceae bacterium]
MNDEVIKSPSNRKIKYVQSILGKASKRRRDNVYVVEGIRMVVDAPIDDIHSIYISDELLSGCSKKLSDFLDACDGNGKDINIVSSNIIGLISDTVTPQGIVAVINRRDNPTFGDADTFLLLEDVQDPGNLGTLFRTAEAAGVDMVIMSQGCVDIYNPKTIRSTMGTIYRMPFVQCADESEWYESINSLKDRGIKLYGGCLEDSKYYADVDLRGGCAIVIGNEGNGITSDTLALIDKVHIPMEGEIESLNASVAGSILMYEMNRQRRM